MARPRYEMSHLAQKAAARAVYRYELRRGDLPISSDSLVVLEWMNAGMTQFTEYDLFNGRLRFLPRASGVPWDGARPSGPLFNLWHGP